jgi:hypothetical protein
MHEMETAPVQSPMTQIVGCAGSISDSALFVSLQLSKSEPTAYSNPSAISNLMSLLHRTLKLARIDSAFHLQYSRLFSITCGSVRNFLPYLKIHFS